MQNTTDVLLNQAQATEALTEAPAAQITIKSAAASWNHAEELRKQNNFAEALKIFEELLKQKPEECTAWRAVYCARKLKNFDLALNLLNENINNFNTSKKLKEEFGWLKYSTTLSSAKKSGNNDCIIKACEEILELCPETPNLLFCLTLFCAINAAKKSNNIEKLLELTNLVGPNMLSDEKEVYKKRTQMSWRERWYYARLNALFSAGLFNECRALCLEAQTQYRGQIEFRRRAALCQLKLGCRLEAEEELLCLTRSKACPWYIHADLANLEFENSHFEEALKSAYKAVFAYGDLSSKVNLFALIAKIQLVLGETESAKKYAQLTYSIRLNKNWRLTDECKRLADRFGLDCSVLPPKECFKLCKADIQNNCANNQNNPADNAEIIAQEQTAHIKKSAQEQATPIKKSAQEQAAPIEKGAQGILTGYNEDKPFAFIEAAKYNEKIYVKINDVPQSLRRNGAELSFNLYQSFDNVKNKMGFKAKEVSAITPTAAAA